METGIKEGFSEIVKNFHQIYYDSRVWDTTYWLGYNVQKCPLDLWIYQEIIFEIKPDILIECGTAWGGSALFFASLFDLLKKGRVITIEIREDDLTLKPQHERIKYLHGLTESPDTINQVKREIKQDNIVMVSLDSSHTKEHLSKELELYSSFVSIGSYIIVEDTNLSCLLFYDDSLIEAVYEFLKEHKEFEIDKKREKFLLTFNPNGYLKRIM